jgi:predicted AAA+ superfamily ATPase
VQEIARDQVLRRIRAENPWWQAPHEIPADWGKLSPRPYLLAFWPLLRRPDPHRAIVLLGPRRVGKTVLLHHAIRGLLADGAPATSIFFLSLDSPLYTDLHLERLLALALEAAGRESVRGCTVVFDEIQYLRDWERHLKSLVDTHRETRFVASGSAAAALKLKSQESGAGRFTEFMLPPLTFFEFLRMQGKQGLVEASLADEPPRSAIEQLNGEFVDYVNYGGYPEALVSEGVRADPARFIRQDVIDKVLLRDLPSLYGISDIQELNRLFALLAWNTGQEVSLEKLSRSSGVAKNTIKRYIEYLRAAFLIEIVHRVDRSGATFKRATTFKVYLTNPSMRAALFVPVSADDASMGALAETAVFGQMPAMTREQTFYARWDEGEEGEVDFIRRDARGQIDAVIEVKWTDRYFDLPQELRALQVLARKHVDFPVPIVTTLTRGGSKRLGTLALDFRPTSVYAELLGIVLLGAAELGAALGGTSEERASALEFITRFDRDPTV